MDSIKPFLIGIAGGTGSGKSTLALRLKNELGDICTILICDNYYHSIGIKTDRPWEHFNFDSPDSLDLDMFAKNLHDLHQGKTIQSPMYDFKTHSRFPELRTITPSPIIIAEGILLFHNKRILDELDLKIFVDLDEAIRFQRRLLRDMNERGRTEDSVREQYATTVKPMHDRYVEPTKNYADLIVDGQISEETLSTLLSYIPVSHVN